MRFAETYFKPPDGAALVKNRLTLTRSRSILGGPILKRFSAIIRQHASGLDGRDAAQHGHSEQLSVGEQAEVTAMSSPSSVLWMFSTIIRSFSTSRFFIARAGAPARNGALDGRRVCNVSRDDIAALLDTGAQVGFHEANAHAKVDAGVDDLLRGQAAKPSLHRTGYFNGSIAA